jgi:O-antigen ligase
MAAETVSNIPDVRRNGRIQWAFVLFTICIFIGLVGARALASIGMAGLIITSVAGYGVNNTFKSYIENKQLLVISLFFWIVLFSGIYSVNKHEWLNWVRIKLPYIVLPLAFAPLQQLNRRKLVVIFYGFILTFFISTVIILARYYINYESITDAFLRGSAMPIKYSHIRYTLMLAFSFFCAIYMIEKGYYLLNPAEKWLQWAYAVFVVAALHIITVRSGLVALYTGVGYLAIRWIILERKILIGISALLLIVLLPVAAYYYVPTFHNKLSYMKYDLGQYRNGEINENSDAMRLLSMQVGFKIWKTNPCTGVGAGDLEDESNKIYAAEYPQISEHNRRVPHNQFIWVLASTGVIGFLLFITAFCVPLFGAKMYTHWPVAVLYLALFSSFFTEDTLEEQIGTGFYLIFLLVLMNYFKRE